MPTKAVYLLVVPGFADWEPAHALAELRRHGHYRVEVVGFTSDPVQSMGGVTVLPSRTLSAIDPADVAVFILPGGDRWESQPLEPELERLLHTLDRQGVPIAAICAATTAIARVGLLRGRRHTSNGLAYLRQHVPAYTEANGYVDAPAVRDRGLITGSGLGDVEFAGEIMAELGVLSTADRDLWQTMFRKGRVEGGQIAGTAVERAARHALLGTGAHTDTSEVFAGLDWSKAGARPEGASLTLYQLLSHMNYWQDWVLKWFEGATPPTPKHASEGWPGSAAPASRAEWQRAVRKFRAGLARLDRRARDKDLLSKRREKSPLEMLQTIAAHNSYHAGQAVSIRRSLGVWPPPSGGLTW